MGLPTALLGAALLGTLGAAVMAAAARREDPEVPAGRAPLYGPGTYAGPGSLGGTESALRR